MSKLKHKSWLITLVMLVVVVLLAVFPSPALAGTYSGGSGTSGDPYRISTSDDWTGLTSTSADWDKYFILTADIDFGGASLTPAGNSSTQFTGIFDGDGYVLSNATITEESANYIGLFGYVGSTGQISDLGVDDIDVTAESYVGGLVGRVYQGTVTDSYATGAVDGDYDLGGLVGSAYSATITNCYATGAVDGDYDSGGLAGYANSCTVTSSYWDTQTTEQSSSAAGTGRTTDEMTYSYAANTYVDWDFSGTWVADTGNNNSGYPYLQWQPYSSTPEMNVEGNSTSIADGDSAPSADDHTDFGSAAPHERPHRRIQVCQSETGGHKT